VPRLISIVTPCPRRILTAEVIHRQGNVQTCFLESDPRTESVAVSVTSVRRLERPRKNAALPDRS
jgi:hypothetical protein